MDRLLKWSPPLELGAVGDEKIACYGHPGLRDFPSWLASAHGLYI